MPEITLEITGLDELLKKMTPEAVLTALRPAMNRAVMTVWDAITPYPQRPGEGAWPGFVSDKQRRFFFAALREGRIQVPYRRTGTLGRRWTTRVDQTADELVGIIGNNTIYAPWVQAQSQQAIIHQGRWQTIENVLDDKRDTILAGFQNEVARLLQE